MPDIDFNCDLGEGCGDDAAIVPLISSASIACGGHAGDDHSMRATLRLCRDHGVAAGAHPGLVDREHFGRREQPVTSGHVMLLVTAQLRRLARIAAEEDVRLAHVKPHGALYNMAARDAAVAEAIAEAVVQFDPDLILYGLSGSALTAAGEANGLRVAHEVFAERGYGDDGRLLPRGTPGAVLEDIDAAIAQTRELVLRSRAPVAGGGHVAVHADSLCLHGDRPDAAAFARRLRETLEADGIGIRAPGASG
ncbi:5-oxoprolinase subunit PxpA [Lysobacter maris]|uniref:5-oxoprolinase subunit PxpA n=1 Tax=Marilutibacter maris TaxID=1605891 RepID=A0A508A609_9GAMM|nr:5-oxoprolinase subunit PxpA [Lysobacter maris]KAB8172431.1 5-oxoprolinase subunit PxpA [Lysobacter maris]